MTKKPLRPRVPQPLPDPPAMPVDMPPPALHPKQMYAREQMQEPLASPAITAHRKSVVLKNLVRRQTERIESLKLYDPMPFQDSFHKHMAHIRLLRGGVRAGKTTAAEVEIARAVTGQDPYGKYPEKDGTCIIVNEQLRDIGTITYKLLFRPGAFYIIRDEKTGEWRAYDPEYPPDVARKSERKPAPPLIPQRFIDGKPVWENKGARIFKTIRLKTGWEIRAHSSEAEPIQGVPVHLAQIDEDIHNTEWITELEARTAEVGGRIIWSARPHNRNAAMLELSQRAWDCIGDPMPDVVEFRSSFTANKHIPAENKERTKRGFASRGDATLRMFDEGEYPLNEFKVFPEFSMNLHGYDAEDLPGGRIPLDWARFAAIDPGYQVCAVLFAAIPPPDLEDSVYLYDELYLRNCNAAMFAAAMAKKCADQHFQAFIIDAHGSARSDTGVGRTIRDQYTKALEKQKVSSQRTGHGFILGSDKRLARVEAVHNWLEIRDDGTTKLHVLRGRLPMFEYEIERYFRKREKDKAGGIRVLEEPDDKAGRPTHLMHCTQYFAHWPGMRFVAPPLSKPRRRQIGLYLKQKQDRERSASRDSKQVVYMG